MMIDILSTQYRANPYPIFKALRNGNTVYRSEPLGYWLVAKYIDVQMILKNPEIFSSADIIAEPPINRSEFFLHTRGFIGCDRPDHARLRRLASKAFTPLSIRKLEPKIRLICNALIKGMLKHDQVDVVDGFAMPLPILVIAELMGIDSEKKSEFKQWVELLISWRKKGKIPEVIAMAKNMFDYFNNLIEDRKKNLKDDLISNLIVACENDKLITSDELLATIRLFLIAGSETTTNLIANGVLALCSHPQQTAQIHHTPTLIPNFIEEVLRYDGPIMSLSRKVNQDVEIAGTKIKKDEIVLPLLASANHDEAVFTNPEKFDIHRDTRGQVTFGTGIHYCLGSQLARLQARIAFEELLRTFERFEMQSTKTHEYCDSFFFRGVRNLWLITTGNLR